MLLMSLAIHVHGQQTEIAVAMSKVDSLIVPKSNLGKMSDMARPIPSVGTPRGYTSCELEIQKLSFQFKELKKALITCCQKKTTAPVVNILQTIYQTIMESKCDWDENPLAYSALMYYRLEYSTYVQNRYCTECKVN